MSERIGKGRTPADPPAHGLLRHWRLSKPLLAITTHDSTVRSLRPVDWIFALQMKSGRSLSDSSEESRDALSSRAIDGPTAKTVAAILSVIRSIILAVEYRAWWLHKGQDNGQLAF